MSMIRPLQPRQEQHVCPDCGAPEGLTRDADNHVICQLCDWRADAPIGSVDVEEFNIQKDTKDIRDLRNFKTVSWYIRYRDTVSKWGISRYESALAHIEKREWDEAIVDLYRALELDPSFIEAHLWLGRLLTDEAEQRKHLKKIINQPEAIVEMMYLDGRISLTQLETALHSGGDVETKFVEDAMDSPTVILSCLICGGHMTTHPITGHVECAYCGHIQEPTSDEVQHGDVFTQGLWQQKGRGVKWVIQERIIHCNRCGANRTLKDNQLGDYCLYCGSKHILIEDELGSFRQPDGVIPFTVPKDQAEQAIHARLFERWERFKGLFVESSVKEATFTGVFLPFWVFKIPLGTSKPTQFKTAIGRAQTVDSSQYQNTVYFNVPAVLSPSPKLLNKINRFDLSTVQSYAPSVLARNSAEIYQIDFDKASLEVRSYLKRVLQEDNKSMVEVSHRWSIMNATTFQLVLMPVWIATLVEKDDDIRIGLVNGQTGYAVLGKARQPDDYTP